MKTPVWLLREAVLATHERLLSEFGGATGVRDNGLLDSGLARAENLHAYGQPTIFELAAAYAFGVVKNTRSSTATREPGSRLPSSSSS